MSDQLKMHSPNLVDSNIEKIAALFPNCITETKDENGELKKAVDFDLLKQELSQVLVEGEQERYRLDWVGKKEAILTANSPIAKTLRPCRDESVNFDNTENLFIEGDNLEALKLLQENYLGKVKMIYIDPPYNTGNDFIYEDDFAESTNAFFEKSNQIDKEGNHLIANTESNGRFHSDWLSMMYSRLKLARNLLKDDGVIFISIDDNEIENLKKICNEILGEANFIAQMVWKKKYIGGKHAKHFVDLHEYVLVFAKNIFDLPEILMARPSAELAKFKFRDEYLEERGTYYTRPLKSNLALRKTLIYPITLPDQSVIETQWMVAEKTFNELKKEGRIVFIQKRDGSYNVHRKYYEKDSGGNVKVPSLIDEVSNADGKIELKELFNISEGRDIPFDNPKPTEFLHYLMRPILENEDIVLDFFAGSGSIADACFKLNEEDGKKRKFISIQIKEPCSKGSPADLLGFTNISDISKERIRRAGKKSLADNATKEGIANVDIGFRVLKIDSTNMKDVYYKPDALKQSDLLDLASNIKEDRTSEDLLFQVMLDWGLELSLPIERKTIAGKEVFYVAGNSLVACFDDLTFDVVDEVAKDHPLRFVSAERAIHLDHDKTNIKERFKQLSPDTEVKFL